MRNRELVYFICGIVAAGAAGTLAGWLVSPGAFWVCLVLSSCMGGLAVGFTLWRYKKLRDLTDALSKASAGGQVLDLRTNREGELSILQNDLYKVTSALAGQADRLRKEKLFLADSLSDISHQLKTPLTSLMVHSDLLQNDNLPPEKRREFLESMNTQLERLRWLISALLRLSRLDAAVVDFKPRDIVLHTLFTGSVEPVLPLAEAKQVAIEIDCPRELRWHCDPEWTREALGNLIKNCVEHTPPGGCVTLRCVDNPLHTQLFVEDTGPGFRPEDLPRLFERFYRGSGAKGEGVGIGLAMAKSILQNQRADIAAENRPEGGARFIVKLYKTEDV